MNELIHREQLRGHCVAVVGAGSSGLAAASLASALGARVLVADRKDSFSPEVKDRAKRSGWTLVSGEHRPEHFREAQMIVLSPGVPRKKLKHCLPSQAQVFSELEFASWFVSTPILAVTGTNGKTSTTLLLSHVLTECGKTVFTGGNIGTPLSEFVLEGRKADILLLEVSSFQLQNCSGFRPAVGVLLNFSANHLDYHADEQEYLEAKLKLFARQQEKDLAVVPFALRERLARLDFTAAKTVYFMPRGVFVCSALPGEHNQANMEAAYHACRYFGVSEESFQKALNGFRPPEHRQEIFLVHNGIRYVNDSKATSVDALRAALASFPAPVRLLAGGVFKGGDLSQVNGLLQAKAAKVYLFGDSREIFESAWKEAVGMEWFSSLEAAARRAVEESSPGDNVILSPATASFDLFPDYKARGDTFKETVKRAVHI
ncbi:MAG: Mur ligase family protein [Desulfonatronovibrionaceae bacterium]